MTVIIEKEEYDIMLLASRYKEAFSVPEMQQMLRSAGITGKTETYAIAYLNRLAEKKLVKKPVLLQRSFFSSEHKKAGHLLRARPDTCHGKTAERGKRTAPHTPQPIRNRGRHLFICTGTGTYPKND